MNKNYEFLCDLEREGRYVKEFADGEPELFEEAKPYMRAFRELVTSRNMGGFSSGLIPYSEITNYLNEEKIISIEERRAYRQWIQFIDVTENNLSNDKLKSKQKLAAGSKGVKKHGKP